uniref:Uncharacterized protein n=1 Tax=Varanus komodoensis TaxID=61221 RepID=A0A8D2JG43_VARKO
MKSTPISRLTYPDSSNFLLVDGDLVPIDKDVGQAHIGHGLVAPVVVLLNYGERNQCRVASTVLGNGVRAGALEIEVHSVKGVVVWIPPAPAASVEVGDTFGQSILNFACFLLSTVRKSYLLTLMKATQDSILDLAGLITGTAVGFTSYSLAWDAAAALLASVQQNRLIGLVKGRYFK